MKDVAITPSARLLRAASSPWPWLLYLPFLFGSWLWFRPSTAQVIAVAAGVAAFLPLYVFGSQGSETRRRWAATVVLAISFGLALTGAIWPVISIYAVAMIAETKPPRRALSMILCFVAAAAIVGALTGRHLLWWAPGVFMMAMVGLGVMSNAALQDKNRALLEAQDAVRNFAETAERERIGRDLHDLLGRTLTLMTIKAELAARLTSIDADRARREMKDVAAAARDALAEVRAAVSGITAHLAREVEASQLVCKAAGIDCVVEGQPETVGPAEGAILAMALREAVTNVVRHSDAEQCRITIETTSSGVRLVVADDGRGGMIREGGGIRGLRSRIAAGGGVLALTSSHDGTRLIASIPSETAA